MVVLFHSQFWLQSSLVAHSISRADKKRVWYEQVWAGRGGHQGLQQYYLLGWINTSDMTYILKLQRMVLHDVAVLHVIRDVAMCRCGHLNMTDMARRRTSARLQANAWVRARGWRRGCWDGGQEGAQGACHKMSSGAPWWRGLRNKGNGTYIRRGGYSVITLDSIGLTTSKDHRTTSYLGFGAIRDGCAFGRGLKVLLKILNY